ncbi:FadR/GntR family transcriptional regulator [Microbulbifer sp. ARAS458-1]|uniref:FadR/GntR family transcriptional regulator n=1 Tax=Microbulbifer sp. ARAS458-1 TaxID=3140242 RepID=UPI003877F0D4
MISADTTEKRLYIQIAEALLEPIKKGELKFGQKLPPERLLAEQFNVSRPTIREAMIALEVSGIVEIRSSSGVYVIGSAARLGESVKSNIPGPFEILEARLHLEPEAAYLAAQRISMQEVHELKTMLKRMKDQEKHDLSGTLDIDRNFHLLIATASRNSTMFEMVDWLWQLRDRSKISSVFDSIVRDRGPVTIIDEHQNIVDALQRRDATGSKEAMAEHIQRVINEFSECALYDD